MQAYNQYADWNWFEARDGWRLRTALWCPPKPRTAVVIAGGRGEFIEKYAMLIEDLLSQHIAVASFDWRGQGLSGSTTPPPRRSYYRHFDPLIDDLFQLMDQHFRPRFAELFGDVVHPALLAHSTGGLIALLALQKRPHLVARTMLLSPMCGLLPGVWPPGFAPLLARVMCILGQGMRFAPGQQKFDFDRRTPERAARLTSNFSRYAEETMALRHNPQLIIGGATYGWLNAAYEGFSRLKRPDWTASLTHPLRILLAGDDVLVDNQATLALASLIPVATTEIVAGARHELFQESDPIRNKVVTEIIAFIEN